MVPSYPRHPARDVARLKAKRAFPSRFKEGPNCIVLRSNRGFWKESDRNLSGDVSDVFRPESFKMPKALSG
jgi:hypothetical protein